MMAWEMVRGVDPGVMFAVNVIWAKLPGLVVLPPFTSVITPQIPWMVP